MDNIPPVLHTFVPERSQQIDTITQNDRHNFNEWLTANPNQPRLDMSPEAARYLIPRRVLELADNPNNVAVRIAKSEKNDLDLFIVEEMPSAISSHTSLTQYKEDMDKHLREKYVEKPKIPDDVDQQHGAYAAVMEKAGVTPSDKIILVWNLAQVGKDEIFVRQYDDRDELQGKGVAMDAYARLAEIGLALGNRYIVGRNRGEVRDGRKRVNFFVNKLGRLQFSELNGELKKKFWERHNLKLNDSYAQLAEQYTISFLHPEEKIAARSQKSSGRIRTMLSAFTHHPIISKPGNGDSKGKYSKTDTNKSKFK